MNNAEPTLSEINTSLNEFRESFIEFVEFVKHGFARFEQKFKEVDQRFEQIDQRFQRVDQQLLILYEGQVEIVHELGQLTRRTGRLEEGMEEVKDELHIVSKSVDKALVQLVGHEKRIKRLEHRAV